MPMYEFQCRECGKTFALVESFTEHKKHRESCPKCKSHKIEPVFSTVGVKTSKKS